ncbi:PD-(D/E)XK nuclease family protein [Roseivirga sp. E12]|uniref:PD-(D/E)XK nuclease family protein n=1 Tax=Roseivirga sp. E12 TaxID=2819237 RepID=UPI001ABC4A51|nr:PD-(D/E)XK nuclease family protein [Roseivirga sp. E12]MBO3696959.1 PD-(D/E)XK nuclease family protein [Roseivirga sp. E12]
MKTFHESLVDHIDDIAIPELKSHCYVFPTKRGGVFFKRALLNRFGDRHFILPTILSIEDLVQQMTGFTITDELTLLFNLFQVYQKRDKDLEFDKFYAWGKVILKDYDEIDRYMADAKEIYSTLQNIKEIDHVFGYNDELRGIIERYRTLTEKQEKTKLLTEFLKIWQEVGNVYGEYQDTLLAEEKAYGGMLYRNLAEILKQEHFDHKYDHYHICGFNALSKSEEVIFDALVKADRATLYWDVDTYYLRDKHEEAGDFVREYEQKWPDAVWINANSLVEPKQVTVHAVPQLMGQAHLAAELMADTVAKGVKPEESAIVLADEKLLLPLLYAIPMADHKLNVTMGYPMKSTLVYDFALSYLELMRRAKVVNGDIIFHVYDLRPFLSNAYTAIFHEGIYDHLNQWFVQEKKNKVGLNALLERIKSPELRALLGSKTDWEVLSQSFKTYLTKVFYHFKASENGVADKEFIYFFLKSLNQLNDYLKTRDGFSLRLIKKIIQEHFRSIKIPFEGEPVRGFQIMGFLETRTLDFKNVIVLSTNEGKIPAGRSLNSYIPYGLRRVFELPTFEEQDAIYAYHFKRLIQRAENVHFIYDNTVAADSTGEVSRFVLQQLRRYKQHANHIVTEKTYEGIIPPQVDKRAISIEKGPEVMGMLQRYVDSNEAEKFLSPTSLTTYVSCPLKFYFQYAARFSEQDQVEEDIDARNLGIVVHEVLEKLYMPYLGKEVSQDQIKALKRLVEKQLLTSLEENKIIQSNQQLEGRDLVTKRVMEQMVLKVLDLDIKQAPFKMVGLERNDFQYFVSLPTGERVKIGGTIDRIDEKDGVTQIIDYKTGKVKLSSMTQLKLAAEEYTQAYFENSDLKSGFQGYLYALLTRGHLSDQVRIGILSMRHLSQGTQWLRAGQLVPEEVIESFDTKLKAMVHEIYDPNIPFNQTEDLKQCEYCAFNRVCRRV